MLANKTFTIMPLYPFITPLNQSLMFTLKIKVKIKEDNLADTKANNTIKINDIFLFLNSTTIEENTIPSNIKKYKAGGIGILVIK